MTNKEYIDGCKRILAEYADNAELKARALRDLVTRFLDSQEKE